MATRGRKSAASLSVVVGKIDGRPRAPDDLTEFQAVVWDRTVSNEASAFFKTAALQQLLKEYCRHVESAHKLAQMIQSFERQRTLDDDDMRQYERLLIMRDRETKALGDKATKLRLTNQSRYTPQAAATAAKASASSKVWEFGA